jgi:predicted ATPase/DNA-binding winged helix-turn-helix (wHTH) protein
VTDPPIAPPERAFAFGPFRLFPARQLLLEGEVPVRLGGRALELLAALVERAGTLVSKRELMARAWPNVIVEEGNLKVHVAALRRALGEGQPGRRYVGNVTGRGYQFLAPVEVIEPNMPSSSRGAAADHAHNLPAATTRTIGRAATIATLRSELPVRRFVTLVGPGGIGKTTVALAAAEALVSEYEDGVRFVDLAPLGDQRFVPGTLAATLGVTLRAENELAGLIDHLRHRHILIVLDSCEHVIEAAANLAEQVVAGAPGVHILATSREPLRANGERVQRLPPLESPPREPGLTAATALAFPSVQLFVERAAASLDGFELYDADASIVADICRKLDGIALAIELAATRLDAVSVRELSLLLDDRFRLLKQGRRTALTRHRTLAAALDWSYEFLPEEERTVLRRLSVFAGRFPLHSARAVAASGEIDVVDCIANLVAKSLVSANVSAAAVGYRLLDITRAYAFQKLAERGEREACIRRHAEHHIALLRRAETEWETLTGPEWLATYGGRIDDVRASLNWAFSPEGDLVIGVKLTVVAIPLWFLLSLMDECRAGVERALAVGTAEPSDEMKLLVALGQTLFYGRQIDIDGIWSRAFALAERLGDCEYQVRSLWGRASHHIYIGDFRGTLELGRKICAVAGKTEDPTYGLIGHRIKGTALHYLGDHIEARRELDRVFAPYPTALQRSLFGHRAGARATYTNILWVQGFPDQALQWAQTAVDEVAFNELMLTNALFHSACPIALYIGDLAAADRWVTMLLTLSEHGLTSWNRLGRCLNGALLLARGDAAGLAVLEAALGWLHEAGFVFRTLSFVPILVEALAAAGRTDEAWAAIEDALALSERNGEGWCLPELLRAKGELFRQNDNAQAEDCFRQALDWARRQDALSWELRAAISLARLWRETGRTEEAFRLLSSVYDRFSEGFKTADLRSARALLGELHS